MDKNTIEAFNSPTFCAWHEEFIKAAAGLGDEYRSLDDSYSWDPFCIGALFCMFLDGISPLDAAKQVCHYT